MKVIKKILKFVAVLGAIVGFAKLVCKFCNTTIKMNEYNRQKVFTGDSIDYSEEPFEKDSVATLFSGVEMKFDKAEMKEKTSVLDIFARFSGIQISVPDHWQVNMDGVMSSSGVDNNTKDNSEIADAPVLNINYDLKFSGLEVVNSEEADDLEEEVLEEPSEVVMPEDEELFIEDLEEPEIEDTDAPEIEIIEEEFE